MKDVILDQNWEITRYVDCTSVPLKKHYPKLDSFKCEHNGLLESDVNVFTKSMYQSKKLIVNDTEIYIKIYGKYKQLK